MRPKFDTSEPWPTRVNKGQRLRHPVRRPTPRSDWATPLLQAMTLASLTGIIFGGALMVMAEADLGVAAKVGGGIFLVVGLVAFLAMLERSHKSLYHVVEDQRLPQAQEDRPIVYSSGVKKPNDPATLPEPVEDPEAVLNLCPYKEKSMHWFVWMCAQYGTGSALWEPTVGRKRYQAWRDALLTARWARWKSYDTEGEANKLQGWELSADWETICRRIS